MDSKGDDTRQTTMDMNPPCPLSIIQVQGRTARKVRENLHSPQIGRLNFPQFGVVARC
jgi:hypothetical protein